MIISNQRPIWSLFLAEFVGTALLLALGLSVVIFFWGSGSPMLKSIPDSGLRRAITGFLFGTTGCLVTLSYVGKVSGAHINPAVSVAFWMHGKMKTKALFGYIISQMAGAVAGCAFLYVWGRRGASIAYGNTVPGPNGVLPAFVGEMLTTAALITILFVFSGKRSLRNYTPFTMPFLYSIMVWIEAPLSGCSTNPARSFGPAVISRIFTAYWLYWLAPLAGVFIVIGLFRGFRLRHYYKLESARVSYHNSPTHKSIRTSDNKP